MTLKEQFKTFVAERIDEFTDEEIRWFYEKFKTQFIYKVRLRMIFNDKLDK